MDDQFDSEFIVVGSGIAGLRAAVDLAEAGRVLILTKAEIAESNSATPRAALPRLKNARQESLICWSLQSVEHSQPVKPFKKGPIICEFSV